jgi:hypothetical protein
LQAPQQSLPAFALSAEVGVAQAAASLQQPVEVATPFSLLQLDVSLLQPEVATSLPVDVGFDPQHWARRAGLPTKAKTARAANSDSFLMKISSKQK